MLQLDVITNTVNDAVREMPLPGIGSLIANGLAIFVLQDFRPRGTAHHRRAQRVVLRALQCATTAYWMSLPFSPLTAAGVGLMLSGIGEWRDMRQKARDGVWYRKRRETLADVFQPWVAQKQQLAAARASKRGKHPLMSESHRLKLQLAAEARMQETQACLAFDANPTLKVLTRVFQRYRYSLEEATPGTSEAVLRIMTSEDYNCAYDLPTYRQFTVLRRLAMRYIIYERRVSSITDINRAIDWVRSEKNKTIKLLWICAHGYPGGMAFSEDLTTGSDLRAIHLSKLAPQAAIWLDSCSTGTCPSSGSLSPAEWIKLAAGPYRHVFAPTKDSSSSSLELLDANSCAVAMYEDKVWTAAGKEKKRVLEKLRSTRQYHLFSSLAANDIDQSKPIVVEPLFVPTVRKFLKWEAVLARRREQIDQIKQAIWRAFCCGRKR